MAQEALDFIITARDDATRVLQGVGQQLELFGSQTGRTADEVSRRLEGATRTVGEFDRSMVRSARGVRDLALPLVSELAPALGKTSGDLVRVAAGAAALGTGFGALTLAVTGAAGVLIGQWVSSTREAQQAQLDFRRALQSPEIGEVTAKLGQQSKELRDLRDRLRDVNNEIAAIDPRKLEQLRGPFSPRQRRQALERDRDQLEGQIRQLRDREQAEETGTTIGQAFRAGEELQRADSRRALEVLDRINRGEFATPLIADPIDRMQAELRSSLAPQIELLRSQGLTVQAGMLERFPGLMARDARSRAFQQGAPVNPFETAEGQEAERRARERGVIDEEEAEARRIRDFQEGAPVNPFETVAGQEAERKARDQEMLRDLQEQEQLSQRIFVARVQTLDVERQVAEVTGTMTPELNMHLILRERDLLLSQENLTAQEKALINARAEVALLEQAIRLDPLAGLTKGFAESARAAREWGSELYQVAREVDSTMSRTFSDGLFNLFTGRKGEDLGKQFAEGLLRSVTDAAGRQLSGVISGMFAQGLQGMRGIIPGTAVVGGGGGGFDILSLFTGGGGTGTATLSPTGLPTGQLVMTANGSIGQVTPSGAVQILQGGGGGFDIGGDTAISAVKGLYGAYQGFSNLSANYALGGVQGALLGLPAGTSIITAGGQAILLGPELASTSGYALAELGAIGVDAGVSAGTSGLVGTGGSVFASTAGAVTGGALAAVALGFTIYSGLSQQPTVENIAINAASGALSGAVLGLAIGTLINPGVGTVIGGVIGAIVGGAAAGGTTGLKAGPRPLNTSEQSAEIGRLGSENLSRAIASASSIEDLVAIFNTRWAPHGEVQILTQFDGVTYWAGDYDDPGGALATPALMVIPEFLDALDIRVGETGAPQSRPDLISAFRTKRDEILEILSNVPFGIAERDVAAGISRRTYLPFQEVYKQKPGEVALFGSRDLYRQDLGADDNTIEFLFGRLREVSQGRALGDLTRQDFLSA